MMQMRSPAAAGGACTITSIFHTRLQSQTRAGQIIPLPGIRCYQCEPHHTHQALGTETCTSAHGVRLVGGLPAATTGVVAAFRHAEVCPPTKRRTRHVAPQRQTHAVEPHALTQLAELRSASSAVCMAPGERPADRGVMQARAPGWETSADTTPTGGWRALRWPRRAQWSQWGWRRGR